jgi:hypothetical protein
MKKTVGTTMFVILAALSVISASLMAQSRSAVKMKIPFSFVAGEKAFPAGEYTVQTGGSVPNTVWIRSQDASKNLVLLSHAALAHQPAGESWLRFNRYGDRYFLSQILIAGDGTGQELTPSRAEHEHIASRGTTGEVVTLVAGR